MLSCSLISKGNLRNSPPDSPSYLHCDGVDWLAPAEEGIKELLGWLCPGILEANARPAWNSIKEGSQAQSGEGPLEHIIKTGGRRYCYQGSQK